MWDKIMLQLHKGGTTVSNSYTPSEEEKEAMRIQNEYTKAIMPNAYALNDSAANLYFNSLADTQVDYANLLSQAQAQNTQANQGYTNLANGVLPQAYLQNMQDAIQSGVTNTVGTALNNLGNRGVLNSSVTNQAMNDISKNVSDTMAQNYQSSISQLSDIYGNQANNAGNGITLGAAAQEAAVTPATTAWNMSLGLDGSNTSALSALSGKGTSTQTTSGGGSSALLSGLLGVGSSLIAACFTEDTLVTTPDGDKPIKDIKVGDKVMCLDDYDKPVYQTVSEVPEPVEQEVYEVCTDKGSVKTTLTQPLMDKYGQYIDVGLMKLKTELMFKGEVTQFVKLGTMKVYDLKVEGYNNYLANGFVAFGAFTRSKYGYLL